MMVYTVAELSGIARLIQDAVGDRTFTHFEHLRHSDLQTKPLKKANVWLYRVVDILQDQLDEPGHCL